MHTRARTHTHTRPCLEPGALLPLAPARTSPGALVVEEDAVHCEQVVRLPEVHHDPVRVELRCPCGINV